MSLLANSNAIETGGYQISRSVRLRSSASAYLNRTPASAGNRKTWTWSAWVKIGKALSTGLFTASTSASDMYTIQLGSGGEIAVYAYSSSAYQYFRNTSAVFRDYSAWYHFVVAFDSTQATDTNRIKIYVNGVLQSTTSGSGSGWPSLNYDGGVNNTIKHQLSENVGGAQYFDGYLTEINFIDGQALTPSSFGQTDTITGSWVAKKYTGTYGTNGFYLNFSDNSAATSTTIGKDYSGNGNNWTPNNISVTAGSTYDSMLDVPSGNGYADGGNGRGNYATLNPLNKNSVITTSDGNLAFTASNDRFVTSTIAVNSGKWYLEFSPTGGSTGTTGIGVIRASDNVFGTNTFGGSGTWAGVGYANNGQKSISGTLTSFGATYTTGSLIGVALDLDSGTQTITFYKNNVSQGTINLPVSSETWVVATNYSEAGTHTINFGQRPFSYTPPTGFKALNTTNLSDPTVKDGGDYFNTVLYTGDSSYPRSITGVGFQPDFTWVKSRSKDYSHVLYDAVRGTGTTKSLISDSTGAEGASSTLTNLSSFDSDGFTIGSTSGTNILNTNPYTFVAWNWKANGTGVSNTAGTITSTVSANTTSGFSVVTFAGAGTQGATVGHGLGVAPSMIIAKSRNGTQNWWVYHASLGYTNNINLNLTSAAFADANTWLATPSSTLITIGDNFGSSVNYVAYCFAAIPGYSAFGKYTGNGSADGPFVYLGFRPRFVIIKNTAAANWVMFDSARSQYNDGPSAMPVLYPNAANVEDGAYPATPMDFLSNGFKLRIGNAGYNLNDSGATFIYAAFAENPTKYSNAR